MFQEMDLPLLPYHCLIRFLKPGIYSKSYFQILFSDIINSGIFDHILRNQRIRVVNYTEFTVMREQLLCMTCEGKWCSNHKCENSCVVFLNPYDREDDIVEEQEEVVKEEMPVLENKECFIDDIFEEQEDKEKGPVFPKEECYVDQKGEGNLRKIVEEEEVEGFKVFNETSELEQEIDGNSYRDSVVKFSVEEEQFCEVDPTYYPQIVSSLEHCVEGGPADRAGIHDGDEIVKINGEKADGFDSVAAVQKMRGRVGTHVTVNLHKDIDYQRNSSYREVNLYREVIMFSPISSTIIPRKAPDGHLIKTDSVKLSAFYHNAAVDMENTVQKMEDQGVRSYMMDLQNNRGGLVKAGFDVALFWLNRNVTLVNIFGRDGHMDPNNIAGVHALANDPLIVLVNKGSASASEILAGELHDNGRAILVEQCVSFRFCFDPGGL